jgi:hypothetical protein
VIGAATLVLARVASDYGIAMIGYRAAVRSLFRPLEDRLGSFPKDEGDEKSHRTRLLLQTQAVAFAAFFGAVGIVTRRLPRGHRGALAVILAGSVVFRLVLALSPPLLETSIHRYLWDGAVSAAGVNPYRYSPEEVKKARDPDYRNLFPEPERTELRVLSVESRDALRVAFHFQHVTFPALRSIYPPGAQLLFGAGSVIAPGDQDVLKLMIVGIDLAALGLVVLLLARLGADPNLSVIYGWSPLVLKEFANSGHVDTLAGLLVLVALFYLMGDRPALAGASFALASLVKLYPLIFAIVFRRRLGRAGLVVMIGGLVIGSTPQLAGTTDLAHLGLAAYARHWESNSSLYGLLGFALARAGLDDGGGPAAGRSPAAAAAPLRRPVTRAIAGAIVLAALFWISRWPIATPDQIVRSAFAGVAALLLFSPVVLPWYVAWLAPLLALSPSAPWLWLTVAVNLWYAGGLVPDAPGAAFAKEILRLIEYAPLFLGLAIARHGAAGAAAPSGRVRDATPGSTPRRQTE